MTESQLRGSSENRDELRKVLSTPILREALTIIITKRRILEREFEVSNLGGDALQSLRLFNQRIGMEGVIIDLHELATPESNVPEDPESTFGQEAALRKLQELQDANTI